MCGGAGRNLGAAGGWRGRMNLGVKGRGTGGWSRGEIGVEGDVGCSGEGLPGPDGCGECMELEEGGAMEGQGRCGGTGSIERSPGADPESSEGQRCKSGVGRRHLALGAHQQSEAVLCHSVHLRSLLGMPICIN